MLSVSAVIFGEVEVKTFPSRNGSRNGRYKFCIVHAYLSLRMLFLLDLASECSGNTVCVLLQRLDRIPVSPLPICPPPLPLSRL